MQERRKIIDPPRIVDHEQTASIIECVGQRHFGRIHGAKPRVFPREDFDEIGDAADHLLQFAVMGSSLVSAVAFTSSSSQFTASVLLALSTSELYLSISAV